MSNKTYWFRFIDRETGEPTGYMGLAVARDMVELFWEIDQYGDPFGVEIRPVERGSFCAHFQDEPNEGTDLFSEVKITEYLPGKERWRKPDWSDYEVICGR